MSDKTLVNEAKAILEGIKTHQKTSTEKLSQFEKQLGDLKRAQRLIQEASVQPVAKEDHLNAPDYALKSKIYRSRAVALYVLSKKVCLIPISL